MIKKSLLKTSIKLEWPNCTKKKEAFNLMWPIKLYQLRFPWSNTGHPQWKHPDEKGMDGYQYIFTR